MAVPARPSEDETGTLQTVYSGAVVRVWEWTDDKQPNDTLKDLAWQLGLGLDGVSPPCTYVQTHAGEWWHLRKNGMRANDADHDRILKWVDKEQGTRLNEGLPLFGWKTLAIAARQKRALAMQRQERNGTGEVWNGKTKKMSPHDREDFKRHSRLCAACDKAVTLIKTVDGAGGEREWWHIQGGNMGIAIAGAEHMSVAGVQCIHCKKLYHVHCWKDRLDGDSKCPSCTKNASSMSVDGGGQGEDEKATPENAVSSL